MLKGIKKYCIAVFVNKEFEEVLEGQYYEYSFEGLYSAKLFAKQEEKAIMEEIKENEETDIVEYKVYLSITEFKKVE